MTPEEAIAYADRIARLAAPRHLRDEARAEALYCYVLATRAWNPSGGASFKTYARRRMYGGVCDAIRHRTDNPRGRARPKPVGLCYNVRDARAIERSEPLSFLRWLAVRTNARVARVAWLVWGLGLRHADVAAALNVTESRIFQILKQARLACAG